MNRLTWSDSECGACVFWSPRPRGLDLSVPAMGECREGPPQIFAVPAGVVSDGVNQRVQLTLRAEYPVLAASMKACSRFQPSRES